MKWPLRVNFLFFLFYFYFIFTGGEENGSSDMEAADSLHQHLPHPLIQHHSGDHFTSHLKGQYRELIFL